MFRHWESYMTAKGSDARKALPEFKRRAEELAQRDVSLSTGVDLTKDCRIFQVA
jgi:hypothetical protein